MSSLELLGARRLRERLAEYGARPKRSLGQNFVIDPNTIRKVVETARVTPSDRVLEIGAGCGSLTLGLAANARHVVAVEIDDRLVQMLRETFEDVPNVDVVHDDASTMSLAAVDAGILVANLPYNIAAYLVLRALEEAPQITRITVMTQREVGERLAAEAGSKSYGQTSVLVRFFGRAKVVAQISRRAFYPMPKVDSVLVEIERDDLPDVDHGRFSAVVKSAFAQRRKTLRNTISSVAGSVVGAEEALRLAGISPRTRAEDVDLEGFVAITKALV